MSDKTNHNTPIISQTNIELTGCKILDKLEDLQETDAASIKSKAFDFIAPNGETIQVQIVLARHNDLFLREGIDILNCKAQ